MSKKIREIVREELIQERDCKQFSNEYRFYVNDLSDNLIGGEMSVEHKQMFDDASGSELKDKLVPAKAKAIDSSSILSYNFFRHINKECSIEIDKIRYNNVVFEVQLRTLKASSKPANIDVALISEDKKTVLFIESKFLEYLENDSIKLSDSYRDKNNYYKDNEEVEDLLKMSGSFTIKERYNYGIKQNICHLIGISNLSKSEKAKDWFEKTYTDSPVSEILNADSYKFMNIIFSPSNTLKADNISSSS